MIYPSILDRTYQEYKPFVEELAKRVKSTLIKYCEEQGYAFTSRVKSIESLAEKIETGRFKKWTDLDDLFACTVIVPTLSHEKEVITFCKETFDNKRMIKRGQNQKAPDIFKFDSTRIYAQLKPSIKTENSFSIYDITFEIQIKSAFEHAWSVSTHDLVYKSPEIDWRRLRLAAQIKATVEQLDTLILAFEETAKIIQENDYSQIKIKRHLASEVKKLFDTQKIPDELQPKDMTRFCDNLYRLLDARNNKETRESDIVNELVKEIKSTPTKRIPRSISLFQYCFAILIDKEIIGLPIKNYYCHITDELKTLYPNIDTDYTCIFQYEVRH